MSCNEFDIITRYFNRQQENMNGVNIGIGDDCALVTIPEKKQLAITTDTLVSGIHFFENISPEDLAYKSLAVNLSDLAAMGADPAWISLSLTLPQINENWLAKFSTSLFEQIDHYKIQLIGGDITRGPMSLTYTAHGFIPMDKTLTRSGACNGDWIYITGTLGDSAAGLAILQSQLVVNDDKDCCFLLNKHLRPQPRILQGQILRNFASSAIDISDGLISDLGHILRNSKCGARIKLDCLPLSSALLRQVTLEKALILALSGGEDYELCFTLPEIKRSELLELALTHNNINFYCIGQISVEFKGIRYFYGNKEVSYDLLGFDHFITGRLL